MPKRLFVILPATFLIALMDPQVLDGPFSRFTIASDTSRVAAASAILDRDYGKRATSKDCKMQPISRSLKWSIS